MLQPRSRLAPLIALQWLLVPALAFAQPAPGAPPVTATPPPSAAPAPASPPASPPPASSPAPTVAPAPPPVPDSYAALLDTSKPVLIPYNGAPLPDGARLVTKPKMELLGTGLGLALGGYVFGSLFAFLSCPPGDSNCGTRLYLYIPLAGPFIVAAHPDSSSGGRPPAVLDGLAQAAGLALIITGVAVPNQFVELPRSKVAGVPSRLQILPAAEGATGGLSLRVTAF
ncbi:MAG: hypothetical protein U0359_35105 [Byssovorax sp.]